MDNEKALVKTDAQLELARAGNMISITCKLLSGLYQKSQADHKGKRTSKCLIGEHGETHNDILDRHGKEWSTGERGFITPDGKFLSSKDAMEWVKTNQPDIHKTLTEKGIKELHCEDYWAAHPEEPQSPYPAGTNLDGPDGKTYIIRNGEPVPEEE
jgi:hypothetical protein